MGLTANVGTRSIVHIDVKVVPRPTGILANEALIVRFFDCALQG